MSVDMRFDPHMELGRLVRFGLVGIFNFFLYIGVTLTAIEGLHLSPIVGSVIGQCVSVFVLYIGHLRYSFRVEPDHWTFLWRFIVIQIVLSLSNVGMTWLLTSPLALSHRLSIAILAVLIPAMSFLLNRFWVFASGMPMPARNSDPRADAGRL